MIHQLKLIYIMWQSSISTPRLPNVPDHDLLLSINFLCLKESILHSTNASRNSISFSLREKIGYKSQKDRNLNIWLIYTVWFRNICHHLFSIIKITLKLYWTSSQCYRLLMHKPNITAGHSAPDMHIIPQDIHFMNITVGLWMHDMIWQRLGLYQVL